MNLSGLFRCGWQVIPAAFSDVGDLAELARAHSLLYRAAQVGRDTTARLEQTVRSDKIFWLDETLDPAVKTYLNNMDAIRQAINQHCFLGLFDYECHFARFMPGDFYTIHVDAFADDNNPRGNRKISTVLYLNEEWQAEDGGELVIYDPHTREERVRVVPQLGTLVLFLSEEFPHEVLAARRVRQSLTGWFRTRPEGI